MLMPRIAGHYCFILKLIGEWNVDDFAFFNDDCQ